MRQRGWYSRRHLSAETPGTKPASEDIRGHRNKRVFSPPRSSVVAISGERTGAAPVYAYIDGTSLYRYSRYYCCTHSRGHNELIPMFPGTQLFRPPEGMIICHPQEKYITAVMSTYDSTMYLLYDARIHPLPAAAI